MNGFYAQHIKLTNLSKEQIIIQSKYFIFLRQKITPYFETMNEKFKTDFRQFTKDIAEFIEINDNALRANISKLERTQEQQSKINAHCNAFSKNNIYEIEALFNDEECRTHLMQLDNLADFENYYREFQGAQVLLRSNAQNLIHAILYSLVNIIRITASNLNYSNTDSSKTQKRKMNDASHENKGKIHIDLTDLIDFWELISETNSENQNSRNNAALISGIYKANNLNNQTKHKLFILNEKNIKNLFSLYETIKIFPQSPIKDHESLEKHKAIFLKQAKLTVINSDLLSFIIDNFVDADNKKEHFKKHLSNAPKYGETKPIEDKINTFIEAFEKKYPLEDNPPSSLLPVCYAHAQSYANYLYNVIREIFYLFGILKRRKNDISHSSINYEFREIIKSKDKIAVLIIRKFSHLSNDFNCEDIQWEQVLSHWSVIHKFRNVSSHDNHYFDAVLFKDFKKALDFFITKDYKGDSIKGSVQLINDLKDYFLQYEDAMSEEDVAFAMELFDE